MAELRDAIKRCDLDAVTRLIDAGADVRYRDENGYTALIDSAYCAWEQGDALALLELLIRCGADLDAASSYNESALSAMSLFGRFDGVRLLLSAGADPSPLRWTPLIEAVAIGTLDDVRREARPMVLEATDSWSRTAWLVTLLVGDRDKAQLLLDRGADSSARAGGGTPALFFAVDAGRADLVRWLLDLGHEVDLADDAGNTPLHHAVALDEAPCVEVLLTAGASVTRTTGFDSVLAQASSAGVARRLLAAGANPADLSHDGARALCRLSSGPEVLTAVSPDSFERGRTRRFGVGNPERIIEPFWEAMIRCGVSAYEGESAFSVSADYSGFPTWSAARFGQSTTELADGRVIQIGGEHEDFYDDDFCIYNDVFVHMPDGEIEVYGYPEDVFPPTDFHTATVVGDSIYVIGSLGYRGSRQFGETPVHRLDTRSMRMERIVPTGTAPGWIYRHRADLIGASAIRITGGSLVRADGEVPNATEWTLDLENRQWHSSH